MGVNHPSVEVPRPDHRMEEFALHATLQNKARKEAWGIRGRGHATGITGEKTEGTLEIQRVLNSGEGETKPSFWTSVEREVGD
jgi:hypothetical protein